jgi:hypothetical protein
MTFLGSWADYIFCPKSLNVVFFWFFRNQKSPAEEELAHKITMLVPFVSLVVPSMDRNCEGWYCCYHLYGLQAGVV